MGEERSKLALGKGGQATRASGVACQRKGDDCGSLQSGRPVPLPEIRSSCRYLLTSAKSCAHWGAAAHSLGPNRTP